MNKNSGIIFIDVSFAASGNDPARLQEHTPFLASQSSRADLAWAGLASAHTCYRNAARLGMRGLGCAFEALAGAPSGTQNPHVYMDACGPRRFRAGGFASALPRTYFGRCSVATKNYSRKRVCVHLHTSLDAHEPCCTRDLSKY